MGFEVVQGKRGKLHGEAAEAISIAPKMGRVTIFTAAWRKMLAETGGPVSFVQFLFDEKKPHLFLIKPCEANDPGARRVDQTSGAGKSVSAKLLMQILKILPTEELRRHRVTWDKKHSALLVDTTSRL